MTGGGKEPELGDGHGGKRPANMPNGEGVEEGHRLSVLRH